jgi:hypothetical protein
VSNNTEKSECAVEPVARNTSPFTREALRSVYEVNDLFLGWLARSSDTNEFESLIQKQLAAMSAGSLRLAAECPFFLVDAKFQDARAWRQLVVNAGNESPSTRPTTWDGARLGLARSTFFGAWYIVHRWPASAELLVGASQEVISSICRIELTRLASLSEYCTGWISPRWPDRPELWNQLLAAAANATDATAGGLRQRALHLLLGRLLG